jgi:uncharacterized membrane protein
MAVNKSKKNKYLLAHVSIYSFSMCFLISPLIGFINIEQGVPIYITIWCLFITMHFFTDYITSRIVSKYFNTGNYHNGFNVIGIDQILHYVQIFLIFYLFKYNIYEGNV